MKGPPSFLERILRWFLPSGVVGDSVIGDLREEFHRDVRDSHPIRAALSFGRKTVSVLIRFAWNRSLSPHPRSGGTAPGGGGLGTFRHEMTQAARLLLRRPGLTVAAVVSLGLGIGANTAIFSVVNTVLLRPLPYPDSQELVEAFRIDQAVTGLNPTATRVSGLWAVPYEVHGDWLRMGRVFESGGGYAGTRMVLREGETSSNLLALRMTSGAFQALGVHPLMGRGLLPADDEVGAAPVAVVSYGLWQSRFGADPELPGRAINLDGTIHTIVGVMPRGFAFPRDAYRLWVSFTDEQKTSPIRNGGYLKVVARLSAGVSIEEARENMDEVSARIGELHPEEVSRGAEAETGLRRPWSCSRLLSPSSSSPEPLFSYAPWAGFSPLIRVSRPGIWPWPTSASPPVWRTSRRPLSTSAISRPESEAFQAWRK